MTDRTVVTRLRLEYAQYSAGLTKLGAEARSLAVETATASRKNQDSFKKIGMGAGVAALAVGVGFYKAEQSIMGFDKQLSNVAAVSQATSAQMHALRDAAIAAGANTHLAGVSASEAASAEAELVRAGVSVNDVLGGALVGSLQLASAGQLDFADAATIAAQSMNIFNLGGKDVGHVADVLAAAANKSAADVGQMGEALRQGGLVAAGANQGLEQTVGTLALFADHALIGSDAGTSLKTMLLQLQGPSSIAQKQMAKIGLSVYDANGQFVGMSDLAKRLQSSLGKLSAAQRDSAISMIFGNDAARAARILYNAGAAGVDDYVKAVNDQGAAARMAAKQMDNLSGDVENLGGAIEAAILKNGGGATASLRLLTQAATGAVNQFGAMPGPVASAGVGLIALTGAGLGLVGMAGTMIPRIHDGRKELEAMGRAGQMASSGLGFAAKGSLYAAGFLALAEGIHALALKTDELWNGKPNIEATTGALLDLAGGSLTMVAALKAGRTSLDEIRQGFDYLDNPDRRSQQSATGKLHNELGDLDKALAAMVTSGSPKAAADIVRQLAASLDLSPKELTKWLGEYTKATGSAEVSTKAAAAAAKENASAQGEQTSAIDGTAESLKAYSDALDVLYSSTFGAQDVTNKFTEGLTSFADGVRAAQIGGDKLATSLDGATVSGARNQDALAGIVRQALDVANAMTQQGASVGDVETRMAQYRGMLASVLQQLGFNAQQAQIYTDTLLRVPGSVSTVVDLKTDTAKAKLAELFSLLGGYMQEARDFDHAMKFGTPIPTIASSAPMVAITGGLADALAGHGQQATEARKAGASASSKAADDAKKAAEEAMRRQEELNKYLEALFKQAADITSNLYRDATQHPLTSAGSRTAPGMTEKGNIDLEHRPIAHNKDGSISTVRSISIEIDGKTILIPTVGPGGKIMSNQEAVDRFKKTGENLGTFKDEAAATAYAKSLHDAQAAYYAQKGAVDAYMKSLDEQMAREVPWTSAWVDLQEKKAAVLLDAQKAIRNAEDNQYEAGAISTQQYLALLKKRLEGLTAFSDDWMATWRQITSIETNTAKDQKDAADKALKAQEEAFSKLTSMLDDEQKIRKQMADAADAHRKKLAEINKGFLSDQQAALEERRTQLLGWARIDEAAVISWGNTAAALIGNVQAQSGAFAEWADGLDALRRSGVSETVIGMLGLDEGPQMLGQVRSLSSATQAEIAALNAAVEARSAQASARVSAEQQATYSKISQTLKGITERYAAEVEAENEAFLAGQRDLNDQLAAIGYDGASAFGQSIADGLNSKIPAIVAAAEAAMKALQMANGAGVTFTAQPVATGGAGNVNVSGSTKVNGPNGLPINASQLAFFGVKPNADGTWSVPAGSLPSHAIGTSYVDHTGPANIHQGERILSAVDNVKLVAAVQSMAGGSSQPVFSPNMTFVATLEIDGQQIPVNVVAVREVVDGVNRDNAFQRATVL
ncbi:MAG: Phage tail tape measure protein family, core region [Actinomycetia bacterium]|nr:Phage tail tape measure protein family, core region [Actinomycetes bacterium]